MTKPLLHAGYTDAPDAELARRVAAGDHAAFEAIMRRHNRALFRTARAILRDDAEAEDALQEAYLQAYRAGGYKPKWTSLVPIQPGVAVEELNQRAEGSMEKEPESSARRAEMRKLLEQRIDALPGAYRAVFMLRAVEEYSVEETAAILQIPEATVRSRFFRARSLLREGLASEVDLACEDAFAFAGERCDRVVTRVMERLATEENR